MGNSDKAMEALIAFRRADDRRGADLFRATCGEEAEQRVINSWKNASAISHAGIGASDRANCLTATEAAADVRIHAELRDIACFPGSQQHKSIGTANLQM